MSGSPGEVKLGLTDVSSLRITVIPSVCVQMYVNGVSLSGSLLELPSSVTKDRVCTDWSSPASAVGAWLLTVTTVSSESDTIPRLSVTVSEKARDAGSIGAIKAGFEIVDSFKATVGPSI